jgi:uncharacterized protein YggE
MSDTIITVRGEFTIHHPAERATVRLSVGFEGSRREDAIASTADLHHNLSHEIEAMLDAENGPVTWWSSDDIRVWGQRPWNQDGEQLPIVYRSAIDFDVKFSNFAALGDWVGAVAVREGVTVLGVDWALTVARKESVTLAARKRAVDNAVSKATVYASSIGLTSVRPLALSDPGMLGDAPSAGQAPPTQFVSARMAVPSGQELQLKPEDITIRVEVDARFAAS